MKSKTKDPKLEENRQFLIQSLTTRITGISTLAVQLIIDYCKPVHDYFCTKMINVQSAVLALLELPDGKIAIGCADASIKVLELESALCVKLLEGGGGPILSLTVLEDILISGSKHGHINLWHIETGQCLRAYKGHASGICTLTSLEDRFVSGSYDKKIKIWETKHGRCLQTIEVSNWVLALTVLPETDWLLSALHDHTIQLWDISTGTSVRTFSGHTQGVHALLLIDHGKKLISIAWDTLIKVWDINSGVCLRTFQGHSEGMCSVTILPDGSLGCGSYHGSIGIWDIGGYRYKKLKAHSAAVRVLVTLKDGRVVSSSEDEVVKVWKMEE